MIVQEWIEQRRGRYLENAIRLKHLKISARDLTAFAICTPQQSYEMAAKQFKHWQKSGVVVGNLRVYRQAWLDVLGDSMFLKRKPVQFTGRVVTQETGQKWAGRLQERVRGLGPIKAAFTTCLIEPMALDLNVCIDIHMLRFLSLPTQDWRITQTSYTKTLVMAAQEWVRVCAREWDIPPFVYQWCVWDWQRSGGETARFYTVTNIAKDLEV